MKSFPDYLNSISPVEYYDRKILPKMGGGRDHISPKDYRNTFIKEKNWIIEKCTNGEYRFSPYAEKLVLKGRNKIPRVLSIPNVRDRFVLSVLNGYLNETLGITRETPNRYIYRLSEFLKEKRQEGKSVFFFKTDISSFFDNINHSLLARKLSLNIDAISLKLILNAITTPTVSPGQKVYDTANLVGVPQGLAISNILAEVYVNEFHRHMLSTFENSLFLRYVDDILIADTEDKDFQNLISESIKKHNLGLCLTQSKTQKGKVGNDIFEFIGYRIYDDIISIRESNKNNFADRLVRKCCQIKKQFSDSTLRPRYIKEEREFLDFSETDLNFLISGFKVNSHNYGWIAYFQQINDLKILYQFDRLVLKSLGKELYQQMKINSIVRTYHDLRENMGRSILIDFDKVTERGEKIGYLKRFGYIKESETKDLPDEEVERRFSSLINSFIKSSEINIGKIS